MDIGVSTACLDVAILPSGESFVVANDEEGLDEPPSLVLEASGGFGRFVGAALAAAGIAVAVLSPRQTRDFARATGKLAKTGALDARALARFTEAACPTYGTLPYAEAREFQGILARRRWLIQVAPAEKTAPAPPPPGPSEGASRCTSAGSRRNSLAPTGTSTKPPRAAPPSRRTKPCSEAFPGSDRCSAERSRPSFPNLVLFLPENSRLWWTLPPTTGIRAPRGGAGARGVSEGEQEKRSTWGR